MALITISQSIGSGDPEISRKVAEALQLELFDDQRLKDQALSMGFMSEELKGFDEKAPGFFDRLLGTKPIVYLDLMQAVVYEVSRGGNGVLVGHGSQVLLRNFDCAFHVLLHSSEKLRIRNLMASQQLKADDAEKIIHRSDSNRKSFFRFAFNVSWDDASLYDLIVNPEKMGPKVAIGLIAEAAQTNGLRSCSLKSLETMEMLSLERMINAALIKNNVNARQISLAAAAKGSVLIRGFVHSENERQRVIETIKAVPGVLEVKPELAVLNTAFYA